MSLSLVNVCSVEIMQQFNHVSWTLCKLSIAITNTRKKSTKKYKGFFRRVVSEVSGRSCLASIAVGFPQSTSHYGKRMQQRKLLISWQPESKEKEGRGWNSNMSSKSKPSDLTLFQQALHPKCSTTIKSTRGQ